MARKDGLKAAHAWLERSNPLWGMSLEGARQVMDAARGGDTQRLHWMFREIETVNPVLSMAATRRGGAAANFKWRVSERSETDGALSKEQKDAAGAFLSAIDNFEDVFEHLGLAAFRGFAHAQPVWETPTTVPHIECLASWLFLERDGEWFFNPACDGWTANAQDCRAARLLTVRRERPVDIPALSVHIRAAIGERDWGRFLERYALPKPAVNMHPNATEDDKAAYLESAAALENGQVTVWPNGASLQDFAGGTRGVDPFSAFIEHQEKTILMLATGGTLMSMAEAGSGTLAGNAQADVWQSITARDAGTIAKAIQRGLVKPFIAAAFPGRPCLVDFDFDFTPKPTPRELFETAAAARAAGYLIDKAQLEEETGYTLAPDPAAAQPPAAGFAANSRPAAAKAHDTLADTLEGLFNKALAGGAADEISDGDDADEAGGEVDSGSTEPPAGAANAEEGGEVTQAIAEEIYGELMG